mgnify:CR=1 FL=1
MQKIFRMGMEVYDQVNFPDVKGKIIKICEDSKYPIEVTFEEHFYTFTYTLGGCIKKSQIPTLSTKPYKIVLDGFEQKSPVPTFEEAVKWLESTEGTNIMNDSIFLAKGNYYDNLDKCTEALKKLILLRDYYNEGWQPNWQDNSTKYCIEVYQGRLFYKNYIYTSNILVFKTQEIRNKFLSEQRELIEIVKPLL